MKVGPASPPEIYPMRPPLRYPLEGQENHRMLPTRPYSSSRQQQITSLGKFWCVPVNSILNRNTDVNSYRVQVVDGGWEHLRSPFIPYPLSVLDPKAVASTYKGKL